MPVAAWLLGYSLLQTAFMWLRAPVWAYSGETALAVSGSVPWPPGRTVRVQNASGVLSVGAVRRTSVLRRVLPLSPRPLCDREPWCLGQGLGALPRWFTSMDGNRPIVPRVRQLFCEHSRQRFSVE
jgi:hypothetical protein